MLHLILGGAGSGKSTQLTQAISADISNGKRAWLIIPEQQANLSERTILPKLPSAAGLTFTIAGFSRLAREVADRCGGGALVPMSKGLRSLAMWQNLRDLAPLLREYHTVTPRSDSNLTTLLLDTVEHLRANAVTPTMLERAAEQLPEDHALRLKLYDIALLYAAYDNTLAQAFDGHSSDEIAQLAHLLEKHDYFAGGNVYIDSFTSFTAEEYAVLRAILRQADRVTLTLCCDEEHSLNPAFESVIDTLQRIRRLCEKEHVNVVYTQLTENHRAQSDELCLLEKNLWDFSLTPQALPMPKDRGSISLVRCTNIYAEAQATALHILDLVHHGTRYGDIAVVIRDSETYRGVIDAALERYHIPFYFSEKTPLSEKPLSRLLLCALRAVVHGWQRQDILTMLKTGLCPVSPHDVDLFEQYVSTWNINGSDFTEPTWTRNPDGYTERISERGAEILRAANRVREAVMTPLLRLYATTSQGCSLPALCAALYDFMQEMKLSDRCASLAHSELTAGYLKQAGETVRVFDTVCMTLTQISARLPSMTLDAEEFTTALRMMFEQTEIASVPSLHDSVTIGSAATLRVENVAVSFVLGLNEGEFPAAVKDTGLLCDAEKQQLASFGIVLDNNRDVQASNELLYVWRAMTKPSMQLFASTLRMDLDGNQKTPSVAYHRLRYLFPYLKESEREFDLSMIAPAPVPVSAQQSPASPTDDDPTPQKQQSKTASLYQSIPPSPLDPSYEIMHRYFGDTLWLTQSRIQTFVQCPYSFYCRYLLALRERTVARVDDANSGTFLHHVLERFLRRCLNEHGEFHLPPDEAVQPLADEIINAYLLSLADTAPANLRTLHTFRRLRTLTLVLLRDILNELSHSAFRPRDFELQIGGKAPNAPSPYEIPLRNGRRILLGGTVDRVDCYQKDDKIYLRVIDYKSGAKEFSTDDVRHGLNLQLLIYLFSLCRAEHAQAAGALYVATSTEDGKPTPDRTGLLLNDPDVLAAMNDEWNSDYLAGISRKKDDTLTGRALTDADEWVALEADIRETLCRIGEDMLCGRAARTPGADACRFCPLREGCPDAVRE